MTSYVLATQKRWNLSAFERNRSVLPGQWTLVTAPRDLDHTLASTSPRYVFFPHWSHIVPGNVLDAVECVCFHMADVPYGRGGSPLQNLIARGHKDTVVSALRMTADLDAGPVYMKRPLSLHGSATEIFERAADVVSAMIAEIALSEPMPKPQVGEATVFKRRTPKQSLLPTDTDLEGIYDHIRMLDADGYPHAFIDHGPWRVTFTNAKQTDTGVAAQIRIARREDTP